MKSAHQIVVVSLLFFLALTAVKAQNLTLTQLDSSDLLMNGRVHLYASVSNTDGSALPMPEANNFRVQEKASDGSLKDIPIKDVLAQAGKNDGINVLLLVDNSGSMYDKNAQGISRMDQVRIALTAFIDQFSPQKDQVGLAVFNTRYQVPSTLGANAGELKTSLQSIVPPDRDNSYTELYGSLGASLAEFRGIKGRRAVIVLSDGENYPWNQHTNKPHPVWGTTQFLPEDITKQFQDEGVTLYAVNFAPEKDPHLAAVSESSGGRVFEARNGEELLNVYQGIQSSLSQEVRISCELPVSPAAQRTLVLSYGQARDEASLLAPLLLGEPGNVPWWLCLAALALVAAGVAVVFFLRFERPASEAELSLLDNGMTVALQNNVTVIGSSPTAHMTLVGKQDIAAEHATIVADRKTGTFTLVSERTVRVNNRPTKSRTLQAGDVIRIEGMTMIFDEPEKKKK
jgi:Ca-activated chloride channel family protein